jgi:hypothetical protein
VHPSRAARRLREVARTLDEQDCHSS